MIMNSMRRSGNTQAGREAEAMLDAALQVLDPSFSRNRNFDFYRSPEGKNLLHFRKTIQGLVADLERTDAAQPILYHQDPDSGQVWLELYISRFRATRKSLLSPKELEALQVHPLVGPRLKARDARASKAAAQVHAVSAPA